MLPYFSLHHFRFHLEPKAPLHMPAFNKGNVIRGGFGNKFRLMVRSRDLPAAGDARAQEPGSVHGGVLAVGAGKFGEDRACRNSVWLLLGELWPLVHPEELGRRLTRAEEEAILGYGESGV